MLSNVNVGKNLNGSPMRGSNSNGKMESSPSLEKELELLLLQQQQQNRGMFVERETDLNINRSGSAPPTVDGALRAAGSMFKNPSCEKFDSSANVGFMTDEEIRSHPAYLEYYYSNENHNPRLPPPLLSKEEWRLAQRVRAAGLGTIGDWLNRVSMDNDGSSSLFSMQPGLSVKKAEDEMLELRKAALRNISRKNSSELLNKGSIGLVGSSSSGMGVRRKSFADILQEGLGEPAKSQLSRPASQNSLGDVSYSTATSSANAAEIRNASESLGLPSSQNVGATLSSSFASSVPSSGATSVPSSSIFELADIADSLSGLSMSQDQRHKLNQQQHYFETMKADKLVNNVDYAYLTRNNGSTIGRNVSNSLMNDGISFPRRTSSTTNLQTLLNPSDFGSQENLKILCQGSNFPGVGVSGHGYGGYAVNNNLTAGAAGVGHNLRSNNLLGMSSPAMASDQFQYFHVPGNSSQYIGGSPSREEFLALQKAYLEALHVQQKQHYLSQFLNIPPGFGPSVASSKGHMSMSSLHSTNVSPTCQNEKCSQFSSALRSMKEDATDCLHSQNENNMKGKFESLLEVSKHNKTKSLELSDVLSHVVEFSTDQNGSRFIQQKLETANLEEKMKIFAEIIPHARSLMIDVFGNYVIQKFLEHGTEDQREEIARNLIGHVLPLTLQMYGCRVIQKALEVVDVELQTQMVAELDGSVMKCVRDQNGNHVIQKCIECIPQDRIEFIISSFLGQVVALSTHPYGCRVIQRVLEHCVDPKTQKLIMDEIMSSVCNLAQDQYGNYVLQHVLQHGKPHERSAIIGKLAGQIVKMSQQKFASNVIEKCLTFGGPEERKLLVNEMLGTTDENEPLQAMMKDPFGNYVVQKVLDTCDDRSRELILSRIKVHLASLKRYTYGKHIVSRVEKLIANGEKRGELSSPSSS